MDLSLESREQCRLMLSAFSKLRALCKSSELLMTRPEDTGCESASDLAFSNRPSISCINYTGDGCSFTP